MTIEDAKMIVFGSLTLLGVFLSAQAIYLYHARIVSVISGEWSRSLARARQQKAARDALYGYATVNTSQDVMSRSDNRPSQTRQTDATDGRVSEADQWIDRVRVDRTKTAWLELMVYSGYTVPEIRAIIKGDNGVLGTEIEAARQRLGIAPEPPRTLLVRDNGSPPRPIAFDPDYPYRPLEA